MRVRDLAARCVRVMHVSFAQETRAWGMPGAQCTRSLACEINKAHERRHHRSTGITRHSRTQWFYGLYRALPGERILVVTVTSGLKAQSNPVGLDVASASLAPATGVRTTRLCRPLKRRSSRALADRSRGSSRPAIAMARLTLSRPPHPVPNVRDDRETPPFGPGRGESLN